MEKVLEKSQKCVGSYGKIKVKSKDRVILLHNQNGCKTLCLVARKISKLL